MLTQKFQTSELQQIDLLTIQVVADWAKVSKKTIYQWISENKLPAIRLGSRAYRIPEKKAIIDYLRQNGYDHLLPWSFTVVCGTVVEITKSFPTLSEQTFLPGRLPS